MTKANDLQTAYLRINLLQLDLNKVHNDLDFIIPSSISGVFIAANALLEALGSLLYDECNATIEDEK